MPATYFALLSHTGETLHPYLVPSKEVLRPLSHMMARWPGLLNMTIAAVVNGVIYAVPVGLLGTLLTMRRRR